MFTEDQSRSQRMAVADGGHHQQLESQWQRFEQKVAILGLDFVAFEKGKRMGK